MPIMMYGGEPIEIIITPATTYILLNWVEHGRRIYTTDAIGRRTSSRPCRAIPSANGSTPMGRQVRRA
jgi:hypothetical protein